MASKGKEVVVADLSVKRERIGKRGLVLQLPKSAHKEIWSKNSRASWTFLVQHSKRSQ
ncbi:hypothetical protein HAX54_003024, partial [Datura stramonium]|nr:hypothetical protein [Datura stramonium]